jgi:Response regulator containing CheY-like receiver domain and AraC-type DNA-binding domain
MKAVIIDDEQMVREAIRILGHWSSLEIDSIIEASNAMEALSVIRKEKPEIVITDMKMPIMSGKDLLLELDRLNLHQQIIVVSGYSDFDFTRQAIRSNVVDYILKPINEQELNDALSRAVAEIETESASEQDNKDDEIDMQNNTVAKVEQYIRQNYCQDIKLENLAHMFYISKEHISRTFKKQYNINLFDYIANLRIEKAKELLQKTQMSIEEVAANSGFSNGNYFSKSFRKVTGVAPSEYKAKHR